MNYINNNTFTPGFAGMLAERKSYRMVDRIETPKDERATLCAGERAGISSSAVVYCAVCDANYVMK
ncbi:MAG: hypothetical protein ACRDDZ_00895 [Marinifilaceae bacterium]